MSISDDLSFLKTNIPLLIVVLGLTLGGVYGVESLVASHDKQTAALFQAQNTQFQAQIQQEIQSLQAANAQLANAISQRQTIEVKIPTLNGSLTAAQSALAISQAVKANPGEVSATGDNVMLDLPVTREITSMIQLLPLVQADKADLQQQLANETRIYADEKAAHKKDNDTNAETIKSLKADCRKSKLKWFGIGVVVGFVGRGFAGF
jgi:hypothetical protein